MSTPSSPQQTSTSSLPKTPIPDDEAHDSSMPLTMAASVVLTLLPKDAHAALEGAGDLAQSKGTRTRLSLFHLSYISKILSFYLHRQTIPPLSHLLHLTPSSFQRKNSHDPLPTRRLRAATTPACLQSKQRAAFRDGGEFSAQEARGRAARGRVLLHQQRVCAGVRRGGWEFVEGEFLFPFLCFKSFGSHFMRCREVGGFYFSCCCFEGVRKRCGAFEQGKIMGDAVTRPFVLC